MKNLRSIAIFCIFQSFKENQTLNFFLNDCKIEDSRDFALLSEICHGTVRYFRSLENVAKQMAKSLKLRLFEKIALFVGLYQILFLKKVPAFAAIDETIEAIKDKIPKAKVGFIHAILQKAKNQTFTINEIINFPDFFIEKINETYPEKSEQILKALMQKPQWFAREIGTVDVKMVQNRDMNYFTKEKKFYIQNPMSIELMKYLQDNFEPKTILDLCTGKGGKCLLAKELFPKAKLYVVEKSAYQIKYLKENLEKYQIDATVYHVDALNLDLKDQFDLVIVDAPCSNSGVFTKHPEAKWRLNDKILNLLNKLQRDLLEKAFELTRPHGRIWYMTCSILQEENEQIASLYPIDKKKLILPTMDGIHGGFACSFIKSN